MTAEERLKRDVGAHPMGFCLTGDLAREAIELLREVHEEVQFCLLDGSEHRILSNPCVDCARYNRVDQFLDGEEEGRK